MLTKGADIFIENSSKIAHQRGVSPHVIGVTLVAFATSLPEAIVSLIAAYQNHNDLALGNRFEHVKHRISITNLYLSLYLYT